MPNFDELNLLTVKHNPLAVCLLETFLKNNDNITVRGFNLLHKFNGTENRAAGGVSILVNENIHQSIVTLNTQVTSCGCKTWLIKLLLYAQFIYFLTIILILIPKTFRI